MMITQIFRKCACDIPVRLTATKLGISISVIEMFAVHLIIYCAQAWPKNINIVIFYVLKLRIEKRGNSTVPLLMHMI